MPGTKFRGLQLDSRSFFNLRSQSIPASAPPPLPVAIGHGIDLVRARTGIPAQ